MDVDGPGAAGGRCSTGFSPSLRTGAQWADLPDRYPPYQTCHRRFASSALVREGRLERIVEALATALRERGKRERSEWFIDGTVEGTVVGAKKGAEAWERAPRGTGTTRLARAPLADRAGLARAACAAAATPDEVTLVAPTRESRFSAAMPRRLSGARAYDADPRARALAQVGVARRAP